MIKRNSVEEVCLCNCIKCMYYSRSRAMRRLPLLLLLLLLLLA